MDEMKPGLELDTLIAEKIFNHAVVKKVWGKQNQYASYSIGEPEYWDDAGASVLHNPVPHYSENIEAAWEVVEKLDGEWTFTGQHGIGWEASLVEASMREDRYENPLQGKGDTLQLAICLAALKAIKA